MKKVFKKEKWNFILYGALFGCIFPIIGTLLQTYQVYKGFSLSKLFRIQKYCWLLWIVDSAPFWLGLFAMFGGIQIDNLNECNNSLEQKIKERTAELEEEIEIHKQLIVEKTDACLDAEYSKSALKKVIDQQNT